MSRLSPLLTTLVFLTACGDGGGLPPSTPVPTVDFTASDATVMVGQEFQLEWSSNDATSCLASGDWSGAKPVSATETLVSLTTGSATFFLECSGQGGSATASVSVTTLAAPPVVSIEASANDVDIGQPFTLMWTSVNATSCEASGAWAGEQDLIGLKEVTEAYSGDKQYILSCTGEGGTAIDEVSVTVNGLPSEEALDDWYGTKIPSYVPEPPSDFVLFNQDDSLIYGGGPEAYTHEIVAGPHAGKLIYNRVYRANRHGLQEGEQFGVFSSWIQSFGVNTIEGGLWVNPTVAGPHYYPSLHVAAVGGSFYGCMDLQLGSGLGHQYLGDRWLSMLQISNRLLTVPGVNVAFDMHQNPYEDDHGIWMGWGWSYLNLDHPREYKYWMSFIETDNYQGPINGYVPEYFNWIHPNDIADGSFAERVNWYESIGIGFGTFATKGGDTSDFVGHEYHLAGMTKLDEDLFYIPIAKFPIAKEREYLSGHVQGVTIDGIEAYSEQLRNGTLDNALLPSQNLPWTSLSTGAHQAIKIFENYEQPDEQRTFVNPGYQLGFEGHLAFVDWDRTDPAEFELNQQSNGYAYVRKLATKWVPDENDPEDYQNHEYQFNSEVVYNPDDIIRVPRKTHRFVSYVERDTSHPEFANWDIGDRTRYQTKLQNGSTATYVWFKFIEQPAMLTAAQNHPHIYTDAYLEEIQSYIENLHSLSNGVSTEDPAFINHRGAPMPDDRDPHLAKIDPGQVVSPLPGFEVGYVPVVISTQHPDDVSVYPPEYDPNTGLVSAPADECRNDQWTYNYYPDFDF